MRVPAMTTIAEQLAAHAARNPSGTALSCGSESVSWRELVDGAARMAAHFATAGVGTGGLITIGLPNSVAFAQAAIAAWWIGATPSPVSLKLAPAERRAIIELAAPALVVGAPPEDAPGRRVLGLEELEREIETIPPSSVPSPAWKAITSGGSTGRPKLIVTEQAAQVELITPLAALLRIPTDSALLAAGPLSHNAQFTAMTVGLLLGSHVVLMPRFEASECVALIERHRVRWLYQVPTMMLRIWRLPDSERVSRNLDSLEVVFHMAAPCPPWLKRAWIDWLGAERILELYAGTELQAITIVSGGEWLAHPGTVGRVAVGEMEVRDHAGAALPSGATGEIWLRRGAGEAAPYRYVGADPRAAAENWESLGDNGHFDEQGYLYLADRSADMIVVGGSNVYPAEIEAALDEHPATRSSCVIGLPHTDLGDAPHAIVELADVVSDDELLDWVRERVAGYKVPRSIERVTEPLRDEAGKVRRSQLRAARLKLR